MAATIDPRLEAALAGGRVPVFPDRVTRVESYELGVLAVPTGRLVACDPFTGGRSAFSQQSPKGHFPVHLLIAHYEGPDERIAAATLRFSTGIPDQWEMAVSPGQDPSTLGPDEFFGYGVDSGTGSFMDSEAADRLDVRMSQVESYADTIIERMETTYKHTRSWALIDLDDDGGLEVALFSSGLGDGMYASYWGWSKGELVCLVTDFGLFYDEYEPDKSA
jgi:Protein of unknown function (DUF4241)